MNPSLYDIWFFSMVTTMLWMCFYIETIARLMPEWLKEIIARHDSKITATNYKKLWVLFIWMTAPISWLYLIAKKQRADEAAQRESDRLETEENVR